MQGEVWASQVFPPVQRESQGSLASYTERTSPTSPPASTLNTAPLGETVRESGPGGEGPQPQASPPAGGRRRPDNVGRRLCRAGRTPGAQVPGHPPAGRKQGPFSSFFNPLKMSTPFIFHDTTVVWCRGTSLTSAPDWASVLYRWALVAASPRVRSRCRPRAGASSHACRPPVPLALLSALSFDWHRYRF